MTMLLRIELRAPAELQDDVVVYLTQAAAHGWEEESRQGETVFRVHLEKSPTAQAVADELSRRFPRAEMAVSDVEEQNWNAAWQEFFQPIAVGSTWTVVPTWLKGSSKTREIVIHPAMAFGTGHHATTRLCLTAMLDVLRADKNGRLKTFLDLGTGSGILAIAARMSGLSGIGLDIDPVAVDNAKLNAEVNGCGDGLKLAVGSLDALEPGAAYDLVTANILAGPLSDMAEELSARVAKGGVLILSGILNDQAEGVAKAYAKAGLADPQRRSEGEWTALVYGFGS